MSGFLHQLAIRSLGLAPQIRTRTTLPYAAAAPESPAAAAAGVDSQPSALLDETRRHGSTAPGSERGQSAAANRLPARLVTEKVVPTVNAEGQAPVALPAVRLGDASPRVALPSPEPRGPARAQREADLPDRRLDAIARPATPQPAAGQAEAAPATATRQSEGDRHDRLADLETLVQCLIETSENGRAGPADPAPPATVAMPLATSLRAQPVSTIRLPGSRERPLSTAAAAEQAPEVHITIGRLEVNPPSRPAPPPPPRPPRGPAPLSLTDYLGRRNGGRP
jgi:hypothetical protein